MLEVNEPYLVTLLEENEVTEATTPVLFNRIYDRCSPVEPLNWVRYGIRWFECRSRESLSAIATVTGRRPGHADDGRRV